MAVYFVLGSILVAWGLGLAVLGLLRDDFPPSGRAGRMLVGTTALIVVATLVALLATTEREHPREEAAAEAAEKKAEGENRRGGSRTGPAAGKCSQRRGETVDVTEKEFSIALAGGNALQPGRYTFAVQNAGKIQHDLAIQGAGQNVKTPLLDAGQSKDLKANLNPGK